jgi:UDP-glucose 4-epimerase
MSKILVAGGSGYIGSHVVLELLKANYSPIVIDNFYNSSDRNIKTLEKHFGVKIPLIEHDLTKPIKTDLEKIDGVVHLAALKAVGESMVEPINYYYNNLNTTTTLLNYCKDKKINKFIFSSTAAVYGDPEKMPVTEKTPENPVSPYAKSKLFAENMIQDCLTPFGINSVVFRYFNVAGNEENGLIGDECKKPANLVPLMMNAYLEISKEKLKIFGNDYKTRDGTGVRDYIHVVDLAKAHVKGLEYLNKNNGTFTFNLSSGVGTSVLEMIKALEEATNDRVEYEIVPRRAGDITEQFTDTSYAKEVLGWESKKDIKDIMESVVKWYKNYYGIK